MPAAVANHWAEGGRGATELAQIVVELTEKGREAWDTAANVQGRREAFFARTLTKAEQKQLNTLLRKLLLGLDVQYATQTWSHGRFGATVIALDTTSSVWPSFGAFATIS